MDVILSHLSLRTETAELWPPLTSMAAMMKHKRHKRYVLNINVLFRMEIMPVVIV